MATQADLRRVTSLVRAHAAVRNQLSTTAERQVVAAFGAIDDWADPKQTRRAVQSSVRAVQVAQRRMATVTDAYMASTTTLITGRRTPTVGAVDVRSLRRKLPQGVQETLARARTADQGQGPPLTAEQQRALESGSRRVTAVDPEEVYGRIADHVRYQQVYGAMSPERARQSGLQRAAIVADTDIMLADRAQAQRSLTETSSARVIGYRRVLHPELDAVGDGSGSGRPPCGLCVVAADRLYSIEDLMPIHARCRCSVAVATADDDPGRRLNEQDLRQIYQAAGGTGGRGLKEIRVEFTEHGELGPVIVNADQVYRGPREVAKTRTEDPALKVIAELETAQDRLDRIIHLAGRDRYADESIAAWRTKIKQLNALIAA